MRATVRTFLVLNALALGAVAALVAVALGLPLAARHAMGQAGVFAVALGAGLAVVGLAVLLLFRGVARPIDRLLAAAARVGPGGAALELPILGEPGGQALSRAAVAFERLAVAFEDERGRLAAKVRELTASNAALAEARESLLRTEKLATVGRLASGLAHEVGNPLGAVAGYVELARTRLPRDPHPDLVDALDRIAAAAGRIDRTVRDLLDFARPSAPMLAPISLAAAVEAALRLARVQPRFRQVEVEVDLPAGLPRVVADEHQLSQVLLNLLLNAGDAMKGAGRVRVRGEREPGRVLLAIEDEGPGIAAQDLPRIFDPFFTTKEPGRGTGLGLAISYRIMESFGGEIAARNGPSRGAVLELRFRAP